MKKKYKLVLKVPRTPKSSYNHNRFISDLIRQQVQHFHEMEKKAAQPGASVTDIGKIKTELHASKYLKKMTAQMHPQGAHEARIVLDRPAGKGTHKKAKRETVTQRKVKKRKRL